MAEKSYLPDLQRKTTTEAKTNSGKLDGLTGWHRFFKLPIYRCGITLKSCSTPRVYIVYKNACQPRQPVKHTAENGQ